MAPLASLGMPLSVVTDTSGAWRCKVKFELWTMIGNVGKDWRGSKDIKTHQSVLLCGGMWEVQVERRLTGGKQLVGQVHVDIWTTRNKQKQRLVWCQYLQQILKMPKCWIYSLCMSRSWALFFKETICLVLVAAALNLPRLPPLCRLGLLEAAWASRWSRYWARSSASGEDRGRETESGREEMRGGEKKGQRVVMIRPWFQDVAPRLPEPRLLPPL